MVDEASTPEAKRLEHQRLEQQRHDQAARTSATPSTETPQQQREAAARKQLTADREIADKIRAEAAERMKGKPTPTQEENDLAVLGAPVMEKEDDGSGPDPHQRNVEATKPAAGYATRSIPRR